MISRRGYRAETHSVTTKDGYVLQMHRIPSVPPRGEPVFLQHGILSSSADWVEMGPDHGLGKMIFYFVISQKYKFIPVAYLLHDQGYDVWMGNARGNTYSRKHVSLNPSSAKFWQYTCVAVQKH